ncbi:hypothetical protein YPPY65_4499, partial [Yersinia pestis PY-65]
MCQGGIGTAQLWRNIR